MDANGDLYCGTCGRPIRDDPLHCSACGTPITPAEAIASHTEHGRYLCRECMAAGEPA